MGKCWKNVKIIDFFYIFWDILDKRKSNLGQECVKGRLLSFQGKIRSVAPDFPGKMTVFQFWPYFFTCPSLKYGITNSTKIIFLESPIIGLLAREVS